MTFNHIIWILARHISWVGLLHRKILSFLDPLKDILRLKTLGLCSISCVWPDLHHIEQALLLKWGLKSASSKTTLNSHSHQQWQRTAWAGSIVCPLGSSWTGSRGRWLRLSSIQTSWTGRMAWSCAGHGNLSVSPWRNRETFPMRIRNSSIMTLSSGDSGNLLHVVLHPQSLHFLSFVSFPASCLSSIAFFYFPCLCCALDMTWHQLNCICFWQPWIVRHQIPPERL